MGLNPVLVMTEGHCFVGVWLVERTLKKLNEHDCSEVRKAISAKELIVFETTLVPSTVARDFFPRAIKAMKSIMPRARSFDSAIVSSAAQRR